VENSNSPIVCEVNDKVECVLNENDSIKQWCGFKVLTTNVCVTASLT